MRYLKITLSGTALFLLYLWVSILLNSCNNNKPAYQDDSENIELTGEEMGEIDYTGDDEFEGEDGNDSYGESSGDSEMNTQVEDGSREEYEEENDDYVAGDYTASPEKTRLEPRKKPAKKENNTRTFEATQETSRSSGNSGTSVGEYMVIAGSYLLEDNARKMIRKLQGMGYSNAEIIYFDQSQYHSICAGRYDAKSTAKETSSNLKGNGIDSYVHRKQD